MITPAAPRAGLVALVVAEAVPCAVLHRVTAVAAEAAPCAVPHWITAVAAAASVSFAAVR